MKAALFLGVVVALSSGTDSKVPGSIEAVPDYPIAKPSETVKPSGERRHAPYKRFEIRKRADDQEIQPPQQYENRERVRPGIQKQPQSNSEPLIFSIDTGADKMPKQPPKPNSRSKYPDAIEQIIDFVNQIGNDLKNPRKASSDNFGLSPKMIKLRSADKPALKFEITSNSILNALDTYLKTPEVRRYAEEVGKKAAIFYRRLSDQIPELKHLVEGTRDDRKERKEY